MSALVAEYNLNNVAYTKTNLIIRWKGKTFNQITSRIQMNTRDQLSPKYRKEYFRALPIKLPRREIATNFNTMSICNPRISSSIDVFDQPGSSIINSRVLTNRNGIFNTMDNTLPNNSCEEPGSCINLACTPVNIVQGLRGVIQPCCAKLNGIPQISGPFSSTQINTSLNPADVAKRRVRSAGMIKRQFDISKGNDVGYFVNKHQYMVSRNQTFTQNQYNYIRNGNASAKPGDGLSSQNLYSAQGLSHCKIHYIPTDSVFYYQWVDKDGSGFDPEQKNDYSYDVFLYSVNVPKGYYTIDDINNVLHLAMSTNSHYFINVANKTKVFTIYFAYNNANNTMEIHSAKINNTLFDPVNYTKPYSLNWDPSVYPAYTNESNLVTWNSTDPSKSFIPVVVIINNAFGAAIGFSQGIYPNVGIIPLYLNKAIPYQGKVSNNYNSLIPETPTSGQILSKSDNYSSSQHAPLIQPTYKRVNYKPSNPQFASQGGVSASSAIARVKYNAITRDTALYNKAFGVTVTNSLAYGVPEAGYTIKDKIGYPLRKTPRFSPLSTAMQCSTCNKWDLHNSTQLE